ncbi:MAG: hypothetical protein ACTSX9_09745 [Candidatus Njordarchaeales archaeon]
MPLWRPFTDIISNVYGVFIDEHLGVIASSYDKRIGITSWDSSIADLVRLPEPIELDSLAVLPSQTRELKNITRILIGGARKGGVIYTLSPTLELLEEEKISSQTFGGTTFIKVFNSGNYDIVISGVSGNLLLMIYEKKGGIISKKIIPRDGTPVEATLHSYDREILLAVADIGSRKITVYSLSFSKHEIVPEIEHEFRIDNNPAFIRFIERGKKELLLIIGDRKGKISLRKINGEKIWSQFIGIPLTWRRVLINDINNDGELEFIVGCQAGEEDISKKSISPIFILNNNGEVIAKTTTKGWIKDFRLIEENGKKFLLVISGKRLYLFSLEDSLKEQKITKFDKPIWSIDLLTEKDIINVILGFADGELGFARIENETIVI